MGKRAAWFITAMAVLAGLSCLKFAQHYYTSSVALRLDPTHETQFATDNDRLVKQESGNKRIVLFGDSRTEMWHGFPFPDGYELINRGIGGDTTSQALLRLSRDVLKLAPNIVVIQVGINDLKAIGILPEKELQIIERTKEHLKLMLDQLKRSNIHVLLLTVWPAGKPDLMRRVIWSDEINKAVAETNRFIRRLAGEGVTVIDCDPLFSHEGIMRQQYAEDTLHLNASGYEAINRLLQTPLAAFASANQAHH